jgi:Zn-finger nucleic acid-binding protein
MNLSCPRCTAALEPRRVRPVTGGAALMVHHCGACGGLWMDREVLAVLCPTVSHLPEHRVEAALLGRADTAACPRCRASAVGVDVVGVEVDFCVRCGGVWLDADEFEESELMGPASGSASGGGPYRRAPTSVRSSAVACAHCGEQTPIARTLMRELGLVCPPCHVAAEERLRKARGGGS